MPCGYVIVECVKSCDSVPEFKQLYNKYCRKFVSQWFLLLPSILPVEKHSQCFLALEFLVAVVGKSGQKPGQTFSVSFAKILIPYSRVVEHFLKNSQMLAQSLRQFHPRSHSHAGLPSLRKTTTDKLRIRFDLLLKKKLTTASSEFSLSSADVRLSDALVHRSSPLSFSVS